MGLDLLLLGFGGANYISRVEPYWLDVNQVRLKLPRLPESFSGFRIAQISDIHLGPWMSIERFNDILKLTVDQSPDLLALTGDFVLAYGNRSRSYVSELDQMARLLKPQTEKMPVVAVLGNHDYWYNPEIVQTALQRGGVTVLMNSVHSLERGSSRLHLAGVDDAYENHDDLAAVLNKLPADGCSILLAHEPDFADTSAATGCFDLQISGHSHGGQVVLPFVGAPVLPDLGKKYPSGLYQVGGMFQYTNRGVGTSLPPVRFNCRPEITVFTLESV
jgi:hypothetical protein